jgi:hypothetical protein
MGISIPQKATGAESDTSIKSKLIEAQNRLLTMEQEQLETPKVKLSAVGILRLLGHIYSHQ